MSAGGSSSAETTPTLWGICALPGNHGAHAQWGKCSAHAPCICSGFEGAHLRFHPSCQAHDAKRQRSDVWPSLTSGIPEGNVTWSESPGDMAWFFGVPSCVNVGGQEVAMHVRKIIKASVPCNPASCNPASILQPCFLAHSCALVRPGAQICEAHSTFARQTYGRAARSRNARNPHARRAKKEVTYSGVCGKPEDPFLQHLEPEQRFHMRRVQVQLNTAASLLDVDHDIDVSTFVEPLAALLDAGCAAEDGHWLRVLAVVRQQLTAFHASTSEPASAEACTSLLRSLATGAPQTVRPAAVDVLRAMCEDESLCHHAHDELLGQLLSPLPTAMATHLSAWAAPLLPLAGIAARPPSPPREHSPMEQCSNCSEAASDMDSRSTERPDGAGDAALPQRLGNSS